MIKWRKPIELNEPGIYVFGRVDDDTENWSLLRLVIDPTTEVETSQETSRLRDARTWDEECRFLGPIPEDYSE
jgi:hypothetical protein